MLRRLKEVCNTGFMSDILFVPILVFLENGRKARVVILSLCDVRADRWHARSSISSLCRMGGLEANHSNLQAASSSVLLAG